MTSKYHARCEGNEEPQEGNCLAGQKHVTDFLLDFSDVINSIQIRE